jgi:hypothetical protein
VKRYGKRDLAGVVLQSRNLDKKSRAFWCQYFKLDPNKCLSNRSAAKPGLFWKR